MTSPARPPLHDAARRLAFALGLLVLAGLRHHLVWGESSRLPFHLQPWLAAGETACVLAFAWLGTTAWLRAIAAVQERTPGLRALVRLSLPLLAIAVLVPAFLSADVADYVMRGRVLAVHGGNPYVQVAADFPGDPFLAFGDASWKQFPLPYGPLVADLQGGLAWLAAQCTFLPARAQFVLSVVLFKCVFAAALLAGGLLARAVCARLQRGDGDTAFVAVLWCPLLLNEALAQAHNESLLLLTILLATHAALAGRMAMASLALGLGVLTKIVPVLLAPLFLVWAVRTRRLGPCLLGAAGAGALAAFYWWRFFGVPGGLDFLHKQTAVTCSSLVWASARLTGVDVATTLTIGRIAVLAVLVHAAVQLWRRPQAEALVRGCAHTLLAMACCGLAGFGPWYHVWWLGLALVLPPGFLRRFGVAAAFTSPLCYVMWVGLRRLDGWHEGIALTMGVLLPALAAAAWRPRRGAGGVVVPRG